MCIHCSPLILVSELRTQFGICQMSTTFSASSHPYHYNFFNKDSLQPLIFSSFHPRRPFLHVPFRSTSSNHPPRCLSAGPGPPSPPDSEPPRPPEFTGKSSRFQDRAKIFFAVLFWMSLFFWAFAWDRKNSGGPNKGSRFRR